MAETEDFYGWLFLFIFFSSLIFVPLGAIVGAIWKGDAKHGACLGFLFGPLGILAVGLLSDKKSRCVHCRSSLAVGAMVCRACGREPFGVPQRRPMAVMVAAGAVGAAGPGGSSRAGGSVALCRRCNVPTLESLELGQAVFTCPQCGAVHS